MPVVLFHRFAALMAGFVYIAVYGADGSSLAAPFAVRVIADETITSTPLPGNGATPLWAYGAPMLVRHDGTIWASIAITDPGAEPYCNTHWELWRRSDSERAWERMRAGPAATEREPCPIALLDRKTLVVSANPKVMQRGSDPHGGVSWFCQPVLAAINVLDPIDNNHVRMLAPVFNPGATFQQHSYRGLAVDRAAGELLLLMIEDDDYQPAWRDADGRWHPLPELRFPIRACYPQVVLRDGTAHVLAIGDIVEPNLAWKNEKLRVLQRDWDYVFRRLFYTWTPDVKGGFQIPLEIDSVKNTAGVMRNLDLLLDRSGRAHILYSRRTIEHAFIRDRFFPGQPITESIVHVVLKSGRVMRSEALMTRDLAIRDPIPAGISMFGRLHELADGRIVAVCAFQTAHPEDESGVIMIRQVEPSGPAAPEAARLTLKGRAFTGGTFFTNTPRGGSHPGSHLDLLAAEHEDDQMKLRYVSLQIE